MSAYTPAPWEYEETDDGHLIHMGSALPRSSSHEVQHAVDYDHGLDPDADTEAQRSQYEEALANVRLIVASPAMFPLFKTLLTFFEEAHAGVPELGEGGDREVWRLINEGHTIIRQVEDA